MLYNQTSPYSRSPLLIPQSVQPLFNLHVTDSNADEDEEIIASRNRYFHCFYCGRRCNSKTGKLLHEKIHQKTITKEKRSETLKKHRRSRVYTCSVFDSPAHRTRSRSRLSCQSFVSSCDSICLNGPPSLPDFTDNRKLPSSRGSSRQSMGSPILYTKRSRSIDGWIENNRYLNGDYEDAMSVASAQQSDGRSDSRTSNSSTWSESSTETENPHVCSVENCLKRFPSLTWVTVHEMGEHNKLALFRCQECRKRFTTSENLFQHRVYEHPNLYVCVLCDFNKMGLAEFRQHFNLHQKFSLKCELCGKLFFSKYYLETHLKKHKTSNVYCLPKKSAILIRVDRRKTTDYFDVNTVINNYTSHFSYTDFYYKQLNRCASDLSDNFTTDLPWRS